MSEPSSAESLPADPSSADLEPKHSWLTGKRLVGLALTVLIVLRVAVELIPTPVIIGPETTFVDGPLRDDGTIDYASAINEEWEAGVTPDQNAAVDLLRAFGPGIVDEQTREAYFTRLGIPVPPLEADYLVEFREFLESQGLTWQANTERIEELKEQQRSAQERPWTPDEFPEVAAWLDVNQKPLKAILDASRRPRYFSPLVPPDDSALLNALMPTEQKSRAAARLLLAQAMLELGRGNVERAFELTLACHRLGRLVSEHPTLIGSFIAIALEAIAKQGDAAIVLDGSLTADQAAEYRQRLQALPPPRTIVDVVDRGERLMSLDMILASFSGRVIETEVPPQLMLMGLDPNPALRRFNDAYDESVTALKLSDPVDRAQAFADLDEAIMKQADHRKPEMWLRLLVQAKGVVSEEIGNILVGLLTPAFEQAAIAEDRRTIRLTLTDVGYALAEFRAEQETFPETLQELVPNHIDAVPLDPYTGDPLKYKRTDGGFLLYSVGKNSIDDGGIMDGMANRDDIAFGDTPDEEVDGE